MLFYLKFNIITSLLKWGRGAGNNQ